MKGQQASAPAPTSKDTKTSSNPVEAQGKRIHHGIEQGPIDIKGKFRNWPGMRSK